MVDIKQQELLEKEMKKMVAIDKTFSYTRLDFLFPWHMRLGKHEENDEGDDFAYTPFKTFNRRRNFLVWLHCDKFQHLFNSEEVQRRNQAESLVFKTSVASKLLGVLTLMNLRFYKRPVGRPWSFDIGLVYVGAYLILGSNIPGVFMTWHLYSEQVQKLLESDKMKKRGLRNANEFLNQTALADHKCVYYSWDMELAKYY